MKLKIFLSLQEQISYCNLLHPINYTTLDTHANFHPRFPRFNKQSKFYCISFSFTCQRQTTFEHSSGIIVDRRTRTKNLEERGTARVTSREHRKRIPPHFHGSRRIKSLVAGSRWSDDFSRCPLVNDWSRRCW